MKNLLQHPASWAGAVLFVLVLVRTRQRKQNSTQRSVRPQSEVTLQRSPIEFPTAQELIGSAYFGRVGAVATFEGVTRNNFNDKTVLTLEYEAYTSMALKVLDEIVDEALAQIEGLDKVYIIHKIGSCPVGETSLFIAAMSAHRGPALRAIPLLVDHLKQRAPIWKLEKYAKEEATWKENPEWTSFQNLRAKSHNQ